MWLLLPYKLRLASLRENHMSKAFSDFYLANEIVETEHDDSAMSVQQLYDLQDHIDTLLSIIDSEQNLEDWVEFKISRAQQDIAEVTSYLKNNPHSETAEEEKIEADAGKKSPTEKLAEMFDLPIDKVIEYGSDQVALKNSALNKKINLGLREKAVQNLTEEKYLKEIALDCDVKNLRMQAARKINSENYLKDLIKNGSGVVRYEAIKKIDDQNILADVAINEKIEAIRNAAIEKIVDDKKLKEIFNKVTNPEDKFLILEKISDPVFLKKISLNKDEHDLLRKDAIYKIDDELTLFKIAKDEDTSTLLKEAALFKIKDQNNLKNLFSLHELDWKIRELLVQKITDKNFIKDVAKQEKEFDPDVRSWAVKKITDKKFLEKILKDESEDVVKNSIEHRIRQLK